MIADQEKINGCVRFAFQLSPFFKPGCQKKTFIFMLICFINMLPMFKYDKYITNSIIITKYINKTYQHKNKCLLLTARFKKGR
jgi:hypothetical protein